MRQSTILRVISCLITPILPLAAEAGSFVLNEQSVSGLGLSFAGGAAQAEDASTLFFNPAGLARLEQGELQFGLHAIIPSAEFTNRGSRYNLPGTPFDGLPVTGNNGGNGGVNHILGNLYLTQPVFRSPKCGDLTVGVGLTSPFGLETDYDPAWVGRYAALRTNLTTIDIQPTVSYRIDRLSFGAGLDVQRASARLSQTIAFGLAALGITWQQCLGAVFMSGLAFAVLTLLGIRSWLAEAISPSMKHSFVVGIGLFLLLFAWIITQSFRASLHPSNWLLRKAYLASMVCSFCDGYALLNHRSDSYTIS